MSIFGLNGKYPGWEGAGLLGCSGRAQSDRWNDLAQSHVDGAIARKLLQKYTDHVIYNPCNSMSELRSHRPYICYSDAPAARRPYDISLPTNFVLLDEVIEICGGNASGHPRYKGRLSTLA